MVIRYIFLIVFMLLGISQSWALTVTPTDPSQKLQTIDKKIHTLETKLTVAQIQQQKLKGSLKKTETNIGFIAKKISKTNQKLTITQKLLQQHQKKKLSYETQLKNQQERVPTELGAAYQLEHTPALKMFLNSEDPEKINRHLYYMGCLSATRLGLVHLIEENTATITDSSQQVQIQQKHLQKVQHQQLSQEQKLAVEKATRQSLLKKTEKMLRGTLEELNRLKQDKRRLEAVIEKIHPTSTTEPMTWNAKGIGKGKLVASGRIVQSYGQLLANGQWRATGTIIAAPAGSPIHSIADGNVVFADWLKGFGLLVIIQHGNNYLSLYGRNQSIYAKVGQKVHSGDVIATVGNSGGFVDSGVYFEVRHNGKPINPKRWL